MPCFTHVFTRQPDGVEKSEDRSNRFRQGAASAGFQPVKSEVLRILEAAPSAQPKSGDECKTRRCRRERERQQQQQEQDETDDSGVPPS